MNGQQIRLPAGAEYDIDRYGDFPLYSVVRGIGLAAPAGPSLFFFNFMQGQTIPGTAAVLATALDTNLDQAGSRLGYTEEMMIHSVCWQFPHEATVLPVPAVDHPFMSDMIQVIDHFYFAFKVNNMIYSEGTLDAFPFFGGLYVETTENIAEYVNNAMPQSQSAKPLAVPLHITGKSKIMGELQWPYGWPALAACGTIAANLDYIFRCWLLGIRARYQGTTIGK